MKVKALGKRKGEQDVDILATKKQGGLSNTVQDEWGGVEREEGKGGRVIIMIIISVFRIAGVHHVRVGLT